MAECNYEETLKLHIFNSDFERTETVEYPNKGKSYFYTDGVSTAIIIDVDICNAGESKEMFNYSNITNKQNEYMKKYRRVFRFLEEDSAGIEAHLNDYACQEDELLASSHTSDRADFADSTPLENYFEEHFLKVYGSDSTKYLWKEYGITAPDGNTKYVDYYIKSKSGDIAIEENGVSYHHPQVIGKERYRRQLEKQNTCVAMGIKLYRFSTEDCEFEDRFDDDIKSFIGKSTDEFEESGLVVSRPFKLYEHQENTLKDIESQRTKGIQSFLVVFPTASGKSKIVEEDIRNFAAVKKDPRVLILAPNKEIINDWTSRVENGELQLIADIQISTFAYMERHFAEYEPVYFDYIVVDEAHHAVAPGIKRMIQHFNPEFLIGLTATDQRPDKRRLETVFGTYRVGLSLQDAMLKGIVAKANAFRIETNIDLSKVRINGTEFVNADLEKSIKVTSRNELIVDVIKEYFCSGEIAERQGLVFCVNVSHANEMARLLNSEGISAEPYSSKSKNPEKIMERFKKHELRFLCTCQMISEGWDYPELGIIVMARPTLSKVLYLQQLGRGLRKTDTKKNVFVVDVVDEYGAMIQPCSLHSIFANPYYVPFGDITERHYSIGDCIEIDGLVERVERITEIEINSFAEKYEGYLSQEQLARDFYVSTGTITNWIKKGAVRPSVSFDFGSKKIYMFSPEDVAKIKNELGIKEHNDETIYDDFFEFLSERDYTLSYKMPFVLSFIKHMDSSGDANIDDVLEDYTEFYRNRIQKGLTVDRKSCPYNEVSVEDKKFMKRNMLSNPFEKFERKRFIYYSKELNVISMNHALHGKLTNEDYKRITEQMNSDLKDYYSKI